MFQPFQNTDLKEKTLFYNIITTEYRSNAELQVDQYCNGITVVNIGTVAMDVNGIPLAPPVAPMLLGEAQGFGGNRNEIFLGRIDIKFVAAAGARCVVIQKVYIKVIEDKPFEIIK